MAAVTPRVRRMSRPVVVWSALAALVAVLLPAGIAVGGQDPEVVEVVALSTRADLVTDGDLLVEVRLPAGADADQVAVDVDGRDVTGAFAIREDGRLTGLVEELAVGENHVTATLVEGPLLGHGATLTVDNHPVQGPVFSGPHIQPWACLDGAEDEFCNAEVTYEWLCGADLDPCDPETAVAESGTTTTDEGHEVPFVVRVEHGVTMRDSYQIAALYNPDEPWGPGAPQDGYNGKVVAYHGASCDTAYGQAGAPDVLSADILARGFITYSHAANNSGHNCNLVTQAEAMLSVKERIAERYGEIRYMIGSGCSGGALAQYWMANAYPGLYQSITVACSFMDAWSSAMQYLEYFGLRNYFESADGLQGGWTPAQWDAVYGHPNFANAITFTEVIPNSGQPDRDCPLVPDEDVYDAESNPDGLRCTLQDWWVNVLGRNAESGLPNRPIGNVGVQYGLDALLEGVILPEQFVSLNTNIGGFDDDLNYIPERTEHDEGANATIYRAGGNNTAANLDEVVIIDYRGPDPGAFHDTYRTYAIRDRIIRQHGDAENMLLWRGSVPLFGDVTFEDDAILVADEWLAAVEADGSDASFADKIDANRPDSAVDRCANGVGTEMPASYCDALVDVYSTPRMAAGAPSTDDVMQCDLMPIEEFDYSANPLFTDAHRDALREAFPEGVCDWSRPDPEFTETVPWLDYTAGPGGEPLGPAPTSVPFGPGEGGGPRRFAGPERTATAVAVSGTGVGEADTVVIASAGSFADALVASPLAVALQAPLLLSGPDGLPTTTAGEVDRLGASSAILVGGTAVLGDGVVGDLEALGVTVQRLAGSDRFATAVAVAAAMDVGPGEVVLASSEDFADALSGSALAATAVRPLLLTTRDALPATTAEALDGVPAVTIVGGVQAVSAVVASAVADAGVAAVERLSGPDRYATSAAVALEALSRGATTDVVWLATGRNFPDGLVAGAAAARDGGILLLVDGLDPAGSPASTALLAELAVQPLAVRLAGGTAAISTAVEEAIAAVLST